MKVVCLWFDSPAPVEKVAEHCLRFSPQICFRKDHAVFIEIGKCHRLFTEEGFLARLHVIIRRLDLSASVAIGKDIPDSLLMAKYKNRSIDALPLEALIDLADPFDKDPVIQKYVWKLVSAFKDLGIRDLKSFRQIPTSELTTRFGPIGILCKQRVLGEMGLAWPFWKPEEIIREKVEFPYFEFYGELEPLVFELKKQLDSIFQRLWARGKKAQRMEVRIYCEVTSVNPQRYRSYTFDFLIAQSATKGALNIIKERLSKEFQKAPIISPIEGLEVIVLTMVSGSLGQKNFLDNGEETAEQMSALLGQLAEACGKENIFQAELTEERLPERSWKKVLNLSPAQKAEAPLADYIPERPTYLMKPEKIEVTNGFVFIRKKPFKITSFPDEVERISGGWLDRDVNSFVATYDRNYYVIELETGVRISVFQNPSQEFYLHGYFG